MGPFPPSFSHLYILLTVNYVSKWVEAIPTRTNEASVVDKFLRSHIFTRTYDHDKFVNESEAEKFGLISKNRSFIKEKGFHHLEDFFRKKIADKGWRELCQPPHPAATSEEQEFYANLSSHVLKKVQVRRVLVDFSAKSINQYYNLDPVPFEPFDRLHA